MNYSHRCIFACVLALIFLGSLSAHAQHGSDLGDAPMLLDINATESLSLQNTRWHALHADAVIAAHRVHLNTDALKFYTPPAFKKQRWSETVRADHGRPVFAYGVAGIEQAVEPDC